MILDPQSTERRLIEQFLDVLQDLPDVHVKPKALENAGPSGETGRDAEIDVQIAGKAFTLFIANARQESGRRLGPRQMAL